MAPSGFTPNCLLVTFAAFVLRVDVVYAQLASDATCYSPDGVAASGNFPCFLGQQVSACCAIGNLCLSTGLCEPQNSIGVSNVIRGTCTDSTWTSSSCPQYCLGSSTGGTNLISCQNVTSNNQDFCCDHSNGCCDSGIGRFRIGVEATIVATLGSNGASVTLLQSATLTSSIISGQSSAATTSSATSTSASLATATSLATLPSAAASPSNNNTAIGVGVGVGVGVFVLLVLVLGGFCLFRIRSKKRAVTEHPPKSAAYMNDTNEANGYHQPHNLGAEGDESAGEHGEQMRSELAETGIPRAELDDMSRPVELGS